MKIKASSGTFIVALLNKEKPQDSSAYLNREINEGRTVMQFRRFMQVS